jgi:AGZA family xanthine/uracil permease-like MFS transporter
MRRKNCMDFIQKYFEFDKHGTNLRTEIIAGFTTFLAMAYILFVNTDLLSIAGLDKGAVFVATGLAAMIGTLIMGVLAKYPIALAPGMGLNAFFTFSVVLGMGIPWEHALAGVFLSGFIFFILTLSKIRETIINAIPQGLKYAVGAGIGLFIAFIGLKSAGLIVANPATLVSLGALSFEKALALVMANPMNQGLTEEQLAALATSTVQNTYLAIFGIIITSILLVRKLKGAVFYGMILTAIVGVLTGVLTAPDKLFSAAPSLAPTFGVAIEALFSSEFWSSSGIWIVVFTFLFIDFFDTAGTLVAVAGQANLLKDGKLPRAGKALAADSIATMSGAVLGTSTTTSYIESSAGVAAGGRTGFTSVIVALLFGLSIFLSPLLSVVQASVTAPALIIVGVLMAASLAKIAWDDIEEAIPAFLTIIAMPLTFSIATGIALGFLFYPITMVARGKAKEVHPIMYVLFFIFIAYFIFLVE